MALGGGSMAQRNDDMAPRHAKMPRPNTGLFSTSLIHVVRYSILLNDHVLFHIIQDG